MATDDYLLDAQIDQILRPINPLRVKETQGNSYVQAYEVRAHMARIFGICRWSSEVLEQRCFTEREVTTKKGDPAWQVGYHSVVKVTVFSPNGTLLATYTEGHAGGSTHPDLVEAHGGAITNSESYAFKRAAVMALLDQGGLSLYGKGSKDSLVKRTVMMEQGWRPSDDPDIDHDATEVVEEQDTDVKQEPKPDPRQKTERVQPEPIVGEIDATVGAMSVPYGQADPDHEPTQVAFGVSEPDTTEVALQFIQRIKDGPKAQNQHMWKARLLAEMGRAGVLGAKATDTLTLKQYLDEAGYQ